MPGIFDYFRGHRDPKPAPVATGGVRSFFSTHADEVTDDREPRVPAMLGELQSKLTASVRASAKVGTMDDADCENSDQNIKRAFAHNMDSTPDALVMWYASQGFIGHQLCGILAQQWLINKACSMPGTDAVRNGFEITSGDGGELDEKVLRRIKRLDRKFRLRENLREFITQGRIFGIRIVIFKVASTDRKYYEKPFNIDGVTPGSYQGLVQVDPYWCSPVLNGANASQPDSMHFYEPEWWQINGVNYHRTHLCIFRTEQVTDILKPAYLYSGVPVPQRIMERVYAAERTANEAPQLVMTKRTNVLYTDMAAVIKNKKNFTAKLLEWIHYRDNYGVKVADKDADKVEQFDTGLADVDVVTMTQYQLVAAAARVPATKLLGTSPKGFGASGEYEESSYREELETLQEEVTPLIERHHELLMRSHLPDVEKAHGQLGVTWHPLDSPTAVEWADINLKNAQADAQLVTTGAIDQYDVRERIAADKNGTYSGIAVALRPNEPEEPEVI